MVGDIGAIMITDGWYWNNYDYWWVILEQLWLLMGDIGTIMITDCITKIFNYYSIIDYTFTEERKAH